MKRNGKKTTSKQNKKNKTVNKIKNQKPKLRNDAIFGKPMKNPMNKVDAKIVSSRKQCLNWSFIQPLKKQFRNRTEAIKEKRKTNLVIRK